MERRGGASGVCETPLTGLAIGQPRAVRERAHSLRGVLRLPGAPSAISPYRTKPALPSPPGS